MTAIENKGGLKKEKVYKREIKEKERRNKGEIQKLFKCHPLFSPFLSCIFSFFFFLSLLFIYFLNFFLPLSNRNSGTVFPHIVSSLE